MFILQLLWNVFLLSLQNNSVGRSPHPARKPVHYFIMAVNIAGVTVMVFFYLLVILTGIWASFKSKRKQRKSSAGAMEMALLGNRGISWVVGIFTITGEGLRHLPL